MKTTQMLALDRAVAAGGGIVAFSRALNVTPQAINGGWRRRGYTPLTRAIQIERLWAIPAADLVADDVRQALEDHETRDVL